MGKSVLVALATGFAPTAYRTPLFVESTTPATLTRMKNVWLPKAVDWADKPPAAAYETACDESTLYES